MRARLLKIGAYVLAGFVVNLVVAWGCVVAHGVVPFEWNPYYNPHTGDPVAFFVNQRFGTEWVNGCARPGTLIGRYPEKVKHYTGSPWWPREAVTLSGREFAQAAGWPLLSFSAWQTIVEHELPGDEGLQWERSVHTGMAWSTPVKSGWDNELPALLPYLPIWRGVIINTGVYAALMWVLIAAPQALRRHLRRRRNQYPSCGYPDAGTGRCPECGEVLGGLHPFDGGDAEHGEALFEDASGEVAQAQA